MSRTHEESTYKRDLKKRIELIYLVLDNMNNQKLDICSLIEFKMNETILKINETDFIFDADKLHSKLIIVDWIFYEICMNGHCIKIKKFKVLS